VQIATLRGIKSERLYLSSTSSQPTELAAYPLLIMNNTIQYTPSTIAIVILGYLSIISYAQEELTSAQRFTQEIGDDPINNIDPSLWISFVNLCDTIAPFCGIIVFLAPLQTINQINKDKSGKC